MHIKTFRAVNMKEAIAAVKAGLGSDAVVLSTKTLKSFGNLRRTGVEVTAALDPSLTGKGNGAARVPARPSAPSPEPAFDLGLDRIANLAARIEAIEKSRTESDLRNRLDRMSLQLDSLGEALERLTAAGADAQRGRILAESANGGEDEPCFNVPFQKAYNRLVRAGVDAAFAREIVGEAAFKMSGKQTSDDFHILDHVAEAIMGRISVRNPFAQIGDRQRICALVGPTGVGKTTTIAKLAAGQVFDRGKKAAFLTVDTFRVGAVEQLRTYARILNAPLEVANDAADLRARIARHADKDAIFIDTAGMSQRDGKMMRRLSDCLDGAKDIEIHLIVSATTQSRDLVDIADNYGILPISTLIASKLDESGAMGGIFNLAARRNLPLSYFTVGQNVPDDIEAATRERLADRVLGITAN